MPQNKNILIIKLGALGDVVQALGPMRSIRAHHPDAHITVLTTKPFVDLIARSGYADTIWTDERPRWYQPGKWMDLRARLNGGKFSRVYDLQNNDRTALYLNLFSPRPEWVGAAKGASHRNASPLRTAGLAFEGHRQTLALAGITDIAVDPMDWMEADGERFGLKKPYILIVPGCSPKRPEKRWPSELYGLLCIKLADHGYQSVLIGTDSEKNLTHHITALCPAAIDLAGQTSLFDLPALARGAAGAVGNDTGPMHLIAPTGCPSLVLFSRFSNPVRHAPAGPHVISLQHETLADLPVDDVMVKILALLR